MINKFLDVASKLTFALVLGSIFSVFLTACGQTGPLYLPTPEQSEPYE